MEAHRLPNVIKLHQKSRVLELSFDDGAHFELPCEYLRVYSPSAEVRGHMPGQEKLQLGKEQVSITDVRQVGSYAVKLFFDDGHNSGLYDWRYLYKLGVQRDALWKDYLQRLERAGQRRNGPDPFEDLAAQTAAHQSTTT